MTDYDTAVLAALPDGYWKCDEAAGTTLADSSGHAHPLLGSGAVIENYRIVGPSANIPVALDFNVGGVSPVCATPGVGSYGIGQPFTVEGWIASVNLGGVSRQVLLTKGFSTAEARPWWVLGLDNNASPIFWLRNAGGSDFKLNVSGALNDATYPQRGPYHHLVGTYNPSSTTAKLYVDGMPAKSMTVPNTGWGTNAQGLTCGEFNTDQTGAWTAGLAIYPSLFTDAGVLDHFNLGIAGNAFYVSQLAAQLGSCEAVLAQILAAVRKTY